MIDVGVEVQDMKGIDLELFVFFITDSRGLHFGEHETQYCPIPHL